METVSDFIFGGSKITADGDCGHEIKRRLLLGRKVMTNLDSILKSSAIILPQNSGIRASEEGLEAIANLTSSKSGRKANEVGDYYKKGKQ